MKIQSSQPIQQAAAYKKITQPTQTDASIKKDKVEISEEARALRTNKNEARETRLNELRAQIDNGTYKLNAEQTALSVYQSWKSSGLL